MTTVGTPEIHAPLPAEPTGDTSIGHAVLWFPEIFTSKSHLLLKQAVHSLLLASGLELTPAASYYRESFSVGLFNVSRKDESAALSALRKVLGQLLPNSLALIAARTDKDTWTITGGPFDGNTTMFANVFLNEATMAAAEQDLQKQRAITELGIEILKSFLNAQTQPPENPS